MNGMLIICKTIMSTNFLLETKLTNNSWITWRSNNTAWCHKIYIRFKLKALRKTMFSMTSVLSKALK